MMVMTSRGKAVTSDGAQDADVEEETTSQMMTQLALMEVIRTANQGKERMEMRSNHQTDAVRNHIIIMGVAMTLLTLVVIVILIFHLPARKILTLILICTKLAVKVGVDIESVRPLG